MHCPRCHNSVLDERNREGVTMDVCVTCRGIWLDRGELEKLIDREHRVYDDYYKEYDRYRAATYPKSHYQAYKRPKSWIETLGDIFD